MYYYYTPSGQELVTPNKDWAFARAAFYGTDVYQLILEPNNYGKEK